MRVHSPLCRTVMEQKTPQLGEIQDTGTFSGSLSHASDIGNNSLLQSFGSHSSVGSHHGKG